MVIPPRVDETRTGSARVLSVNAGRLRPFAATSTRVTGHFKAPVPELVVSDPGPDARVSGAAGDELGDPNFHGGRDQALYAFACEDLDAWASELGRDLPSGSFAENLTTAGLDVNAAVLGERWRIGADVIVVVTHPRTPCRTFAGVMDVPHWVKRFTAVGRPGPYLRVEQGGVIRPGDPIEVLSRPDHGVTLADLFAAMHTDAELVSRVLTAGDDLTDYARGKLAKRAR